MRFGLQLVLCVGLSVCLFSPALAGLKIVQKNDEGKLETVYYENQKLATEPMDKGNVRVTIDLNKGVLYFISDAKKAYYGGTFKETAESGKAIAEMIKRQIAEMGGKRPEAAPDKLKVDIKKGGKDLLIAGRKTTHYKISVNGTLVEETWIAPGLGVKDFDFSKGWKALHDAIPDVDPSGSGSAYKNDPGYLALIEKGLSLQEKTYGSNLGKSVTVSAENFDAPDAKFALPKDYKKATFQELFYTAE